MTRLSRAISACVLSIIKPVENRVYRVTACVIAFGALLFLLLFCIFLFSIDFDRPDTMMMLNCLILNDVTAGFC